VDNGASPYWVCEIFSAMFADPSVLTSAGFGHLAVLLGEH
jgi:hypothetical protein